MKYIQILLGLILVVFGLNGFFHFLPLPPHDGFALEFLQTLTKAKYLFPVVSVIMTGSGMLLLFNRWTLLALIMQLPISFNIVSFHLFHHWQGLGLAYPLFAMNVFLIIKRYNQIKLLLQE